MCKVDFFGQIEPSPPLVVMGHSPGSITSSGYYFLFTNMIKTSISGKVFEIHLDNPNSMNAFTIPEFVEFAEALNEADQNKETCITLLTASGTFFSTGANIKSISKMVNLNRLDYYEQITCKNIYLVHTFINHRKLLITALNGPVVGLTAALVNLTDILWARKVVNETKLNLSPYYYFPFSSIGLVNECGASISLPYRLGLSVSIEAVCLCRKIELDELARLGVVSTMIEDDSSDSFNDKVRQKVQKMSANLDPEAIIGNKSQFKVDFKQLVEKHILNESLEGLQKWVEEKPQNAFKRMVLSKRSKL